MTVESLHAASKEIAVVDQRRNRRYKVSLPVNIRTISDSVVASSRDISATGIYLIISNNFQLDSDLECDLELPPELTNGNPGHIRCVAKILRVDRVNGSPNIGVAAELRSYKFMSHG